MGEYPGTDSVTDVGEIPSGTMPDLSAERRGGGDGKVCALLGSNGADKQALKQSNRERGADAMRTVPWP